jgi:glycosyltransferase involved in cell wall biosynthesis
VNVNQNDAVIVQQNWMKNALASFVKVPIHVTHPEYVPNDFKPIKLGSQSPALFIYPAFPRIFKNHAVIFRALKLMSSVDRTNLKIIFTISGSENLYARWLKFSCKNLPEIIFQGRLTYDETLELYSHASCLLFPSKLETWGLPLTEAKYFQKNIICADLPYAREAVGNYSKVSYISATNPKDWAHVMRDFCKNQLALDNQIVPTENQVDSIGVVELLKFALKITLTSTQLK